MLNIFSLITKKASLLGVIKNHKLALRLSRCESSPAPFATIQTIQMRSGWLTAAVRLLSQTGRSPSRRGCSRGAGLLESLGSVMTQHGIQGASPERSGRRGIDACRQVVRVLTSAGGHCLTFTPGPHVSRERRREVGWPLKPGSDFQWAAREDGVASVWFSELSLSWWKRAWTWCCSRGL